MRKYVHSGKFNPGLTAVWAVLGLAAGAVISVIYMAIANFNPYIYLNLLVLFGVIYALTWTVVFIIKKSKSRNKAVNLTVTFLICLFSWYVGWAALMAYQWEVNLFWWILHPGSLFEAMNVYADNINMTLNNSPISPIVLKGCYILEFLAYFFPMILVAQEKLYYCEFCESFMKSKDHYFTETELVGEHIDRIKAGELGFMEKAETVLRKPSDAVPQQYKLNLHTCPGCQERVFNFYHMNMKMKKGKYENGNTTPLIQNIYAVRPEQ